MSDWSKNEETPSYSENINSQNSTGLPMPAETAKPNNTNQCSSCNGTGYNYGCDNLSCRNGYVHCYSCGGKGYENSGKVCLKCRGEGTIYCYSCQGDPSSNKIICTNCYGKGSTLIKTCPQCNGRVLSEGDTGYISLDQGTNCIWCGGDGKVEKALEGEAEKYMESQLELLKRIPGS